MKVPMLDLSEQYNGLKDQIIKELDQVMSSSQFILGDNVKKIEASIAEFSHAEYGIGCGNGSDAIHIALQAAGVGEGDEVITTTFTFFATGGSIVRAGATPIFVDIDPVTFNIDPKQVEAKITDKTKAILPVHLYGQMADMEEISNIAKKHNLIVVEDAAQAIGATANDKPVGALSDAATYSFFPTKNLGAYGDGGMVITNDASIAEKSRVIRVHGSKPKYHHHILGYNSRLDEIQAAVLNIKFPNLVRWSELRREKANMYTKLIQDASLEEYITVPKEVEGNYHVYHQYTLRTSKRDELQQFLKEQGVSTMIYYPIPLHLQPVFSDLGYKLGDLPVAEKAAEEALSLPMFPELKTEQQEYVISQIKEFFRG